MDLKTPGSGEVERNRYCNLEHLNPRDQIKFVLCDRSDYDWAKEQMAGYKYPRVVEFRDEEIDGDERACDVHISNLRHKIERDAQRPELVVTVRGMGYKFKAD